MGNGDEIKSKVQELASNVSRLEKELSTVKDALKSLASQTGAPTKEPDKVTPRPAPEVQRPPAPKSPPSAFQIWCEQKQNELKEFLSKQSFEKLVGEKLFNYLGVLLLVLGGIFLLVYKFGHSGPQGKIFAGLIVSLAMGASGIYFRKKSKYMAIGTTLLAGGWTLLYFTTYAAHYINAAKVINNVTFATLLLVIVAAGMIGHGLILASPGFQNFAYGLSYFVFLIAPRESTFFGVIFLLSLSGVLLSLRFRSSVLIIITSIGFYLNYLPVYFDIFSHSSKATLSSIGTGQFLSSSSWLIAGYLLFSSLVVFPKLRSLVEKKWTDITISSGSVIFSFLFLSQLDLFFKSQAFAHAFYLSIFLLVIALIVQTKGPSKSTFHYVQPILALGISLIAIFRIESPIWGMIGCIVAIVAWTALGFFFKSQIWRSCGIGTMAFLPFLFVKSFQTSSHSVISLALAVFSSLAFVFSRHYNSQPESVLSQWEKKAPTGWLHVGTFSLVAALWTFLEPAPFVVGVILLAFLIELFGSKLPKAFLFQALLIEMGAGVYFFFIDYGANAPLFLSITPRLVVSLSMVAVLFYIYFFDPNSEYDDFSVGDLIKSKNQQRKIVSWLMALIFSFAVFHELEIQLRLPIWSLLAVCLLHAGRLRSDNNLRFQSYFLVALTGIEGILTYLQQPKFFLMPLGIGDMAIYWTSSLVLLTSLVRFKPLSSTQKPLEGKYDGYLFSGLCQLMLLLFFMKEISGYYLTLALSVQGIIFLFAGLHFNSPQLRFPALVTLGVCIIKALFWDLSHLAIPYRIASYMVLGVILVFASLIYVRKAKEIIKR